MKTIFNLIILFLLPLLTGVFMPEKITNPVKTDTITHYPEKLDGPFTGGFGEQTCHSCHFDYDINMADGSLAITGIKETYRPGKLYDLTVRVHSEHLENGGFQMTARFEDGTQAGSFKWEGNRLMYTTSISDEIEYIQHSGVGTAPTGEKEVSWSFYWQAPPDRASTILFNVAANAGNNDDSAFGDRIYVMEKELLPKQ